MEENNQKKKSKYKDVVDRMKKAHQKNQLKSNTDTPDSQARQDKIQDLENRSGGKGGKISWKGLR
jgi:hypothetical protein